MTDYEAVSRLHFNTCIFHQFTKQPQMALDMEQGLHTERDLTSIVN